ncbi:unnamed protein product [Malus baccata var. baccata]
MAECIYDLDGPDDLPESPELVEFLCAEPDKPPPEVQDPLEVVELGTKEDPRPIQISGLLGDEDRANIICLLQEFKDCFAWHYTEMPVRCCVDYRNINGATPKDEYPMPMADLSIDAVAKHKVLSFMDGNVGITTFDRPQAGIDEDEDPQIEDESKEVCVWSESGQLLGIPGSSKRCRVLVPPKRGKPLKLYISASEKSIGSLLAQNNEGGKEQAVYYLSRILTEVETRYSPVEKLCLVLYFTASKLRHYMLPCHVHIIAKTDVIKYMLSKPMLTGRIGKWILALSEFSFQYVPQRAVKGQAIADFLAEHQESQGEEINIPGSLEVTSVWIPPREDISGKEEWVQQEIRRVTSLWITPWKLYFDGAVEVEVFGDSELVINQLNGEFKCRHIAMAGYYLVATQLLSFWDSDISVSHVPRGSNLAANEMAQLASGVPIPEGKYGVNIKIQRKNLPSILERGFNLDIMVLETEVENWRSPIIHHLKYPSSPTSKKNRQQATKYVLWVKDLLRKTPDGLLLKCLGQEESMRVMAKVHEGVYGAHQAGTKMRWLLRRYGYFWPDMEKDCKSYS